MQVSWDSVHTLAVVSSEHETNSLPTDARILMIQSSFAYYQTWSCFEVLAQSSAYIPSVTCSIVDVVSHFGKIRHLNDGNILIVGTSLTDARP